MARAIVSGLRVLATLGAASLLLGAAGESGPQKQSYFFKTPPGATKYTQQHAIDVDDVPGHQVRIYELHSTFSEEAPVYNGVKVKEAWLRAMTDYTNGTGRGSGYSMSILENGDKIFGRWESMTQTTIGADGTKAARTSAVTTFNGGTGKFKGMHGTLKSSSLSDFKNVSDIVTEGEYWIE